MNAEIKYVPVLRWKAAEIDAIVSLDDGAKRLIQPLFEFVPKDFDAHPVALRVRRLLETWGWRHRCFIDFSLIDGAKAAAAIPVFDRAAAETLQAVLTVGMRPVIEFSVLRGLSLVEKHGLCLRISAFEFRQAGFQRTLGEFLTDLGIHANRIDVIIDYGLLDGPPTNIQAAVGAMEAVAAWRSVTFLAGAFPPDLSALEKNNQYELLRHEWNAYRSYALSGGRAWFGDYTIQHPIYIEREGKGLNFSASIRYTGPVHWVIMRGEGVFNEDGPGFAQWPANAELLCARPEFCGEHFSPGDLYIKEMGAQLDRTGTPKEWLSAGINHHLYYAVFQVTHLADTPSAASVAAASAPDWPAHVE